MRSSSSNFNEKKWGKTAKNGHLQLYINVNVTASRSIGVIWKIIVFAKPGLEFGRFGIVNGTLNLEFQEAHLQGKGLLNVRRQKALGLLDRFDVSQCLLAPDSLRHTFCCGTEIWV